jgi:hypothetical protein
MNLGIERDGARRAGRGSRRSGAVSRRAYTLVEVLIALLLTIMLIASSLSAILFLNVRSARLAYYTEGATLVQRKMEAIQGTSYNPPNYPFTWTNVWITNHTKYGLDKGGTNLALASTIISKIEPVAAGHFVTVTGTFDAPTANHPIVIQLQTVLNVFSGGQQ